MSKSKDNIIDIFLSEKKLKKQIMSIETNSIPFEDPKDYESCNVFNIYSLLASSDKIKKLEIKYKNGGFGYGHAKQELFELILSRFKLEREKYNQLMTSKKKIDVILNDGAKRAAITAHQVMNRVRKKLGY
jgi:tryptophanyl-tRNA synthetase